MKLHELVDKIYETLPEADFQEDNQGQVVIYTNLRHVGEGLDLKPFEANDQSDA